MRWFALGLRRSWFLLAGLAVLCLIGGKAFAAEGAAKASETVFVIQIVALVFFGRLLGELMQRIGQPSVMGQLLAGLLLGPSVLGVVWPDGQHALFPNNPAQKAMLDGVAQFGVLLLLLLAGMETELRLVRRVGRAAFSVSLSGIVLPFVCGFALGQVLPDSLLPSPGTRTVAALFLGTALSISSVKIVAMVVREMNFIRRNVGQVILASAVIDDTVGWIIIAITFSIADSGTIDAASLARSVLGTLAFLAISLTIGRRVVFWLIRWTNDTLVSELPVISVILLIMGGMALITDAIGVHTVLGAFVAGILVGESPILTRQIDLQLRGMIMALFAPVFFGTAGLSADLTILSDARLAMMTGVLVLIASVGKFSGAFTGGLIGGLTSRESLALGCGMNARGSTEVIVATIGLSIGVLSQNLFTMIVAMAVITTMTMPPMLRWSLARLPFRADEKARLEREEFEAKGFLPHVERLLLAVDESANGRFAARLTGLIAGGRGTPTTVVHIGSDETATKGLDKILLPTRLPERLDSDTAENAVKTAAKTTTNVDEAETAKPQPSRVDVISKSLPAKPAHKPIHKPDAAAHEAKAGATETAGKGGDEHALAKEGRKGYDLMAIGIAEAVAEDGSLHSDVTDLVANFDGPFLLSVGRGEHLDRPAASPLRILVPVTGTDASRRAAEVAVTLARASHISVSALYVSGATAADSMTTRRREEAILKDVVEMADRYDVRARTKLRIGVAADAAILHEVTTGRHNLIVMGVNPRSGETLFLGDTAMAVLAKAKVSILFVSV